MWGEGGVKGVRGGEARVEKLRHGHVVTDRMLSQTIDRRINSITECIANYLANRIAVCNSAHLVGPLVLRHLLSNDEDALVPAHLLV